MVTVEDDASCRLPGRPAAPPWVGNGETRAERASRYWWNSATSRQGNGDGAIRSTAAAGVHAGLRELLAVLLGLLVADGGQEAQRDGVPLLGQQQEQEAQADDAGCCQAHHAEDHLMFQNIYSYGGRRERAVGEQ